MIYLYSFVVFSGTIKVSLKWIISKPKLVTFLIVGTTIGGIKDTTDSGGGMMIFTVYKICTKPI